MQYDEIERVLWQPLDLLRHDHLEFRIISKSPGDSGTHARGSLAEQNLASGCRDNVGMERFAGTVVENMRGSGWHVSCNILRNLTIINVLVARIDVPI